jgi:nucleoside-diphosphate-sugar epimerase
MARILIAGCGFLGRATARLFHRGGYDVVGLVKGRESLPTFVGERFKVVSCDVGDREALERLAGAGYRFDAVVNCAGAEASTAEAYRRTYVDGCRNLAEVFEPRALLFTSSTSVYGQTDGGWVDERSPADPTVETGRVLREAEEYVRLAGGYVARLSGLYGPGRSVYVKRFTEGRARIEGDGSRVVNQVHRDDAAGAIFYLLSWHRVPGIYNVTDDVPMTQFELYEWLASHLGRALPEAGPEDRGKARGWTSKRVSNAKLHDAGWRCRYPSFKEALGDLVPGLVGAGARANILRPLAMAESA